MNVKRARYFRAARIAVLVLVVAFFLLPYDVRSWFPVWLLFLAALALEADFFIGGWLQARREAPVAEAPDRGPQQRDLSDLGSWDYSGSERAYASGRRRPGRSAGSTSSRRSACSR